MPNSKKKGNKNERNLTKLFQQWTGYEFTRVPSSGGLRWQRKSDTVGDIICADEKHSRWFTFSIETKFYEKIDFSELVRPFKNPVIIEFWKQCLEDSNRSKKNPLLMFRYNGLPKDFYFVVLLTDFYKEIKNDFEVAPVELVYKGNHRFVIINSKDLLTTDYKSVHKKSKLFLKQLYGKG